MECIDWHEFEEITQQEGRSYFWCWFLGERTPGDGWATERVCAGEQKQSAEYGTISGLACPRHKASWYQAYRFCILERRADGGRKGARDAGCLAWLGTATVAAKQESDASKQARQIRKLAREEGHESRGE